MANKGFKKAKNWSLVSQEVRVREARAEKEGIVPHLFKNKTGKPIVFSEANGILSEKKAISYLKENKLEKKLKQIPIYSDDLDKINKKPVKVSVKASTKKPVKTTKPKPKATVKPQTKGK